jgi:hypothetical protein
VLATVLVGTLLYLPADAAEIGVRGAGDKAVAHHAGGRIIKGDRSGPEPRMYLEGMPSGEPTLGVTNEGNVFTPAIQSNTRVEVLRSSNNGKSWDIVSPKLPGGRNAQLLTFDPYVWVDDAEGVDRIFTIDLTVACAYLSFSDDEGESWISNPLACGRPVNDHQTLFSGRPATSTTIGFPHVVYYCWNDVGSSSCSKSIDGGLTFSATGTPAFPGVDLDRQDFCGGLHGHGHVDINGTVYIPKGHCGQPWLAISKDEGLTWETMPVAKNGVSDHEASVATDEKGNIYYLYQGRDRLPYLVTSTNGGKKWSKPMMVGAPGLNEANLPSIDVGGVGKVAMAYMGTENSPGQPFEDPYDKTTWNGYMTISANALADNPVFYSTTVNDKDDPIKRGECGPGRCGTAVYDFIDITIAPDGQVWTSWVDACNLTCSKQGPGDAGNMGVIGRLVGGPRLR